MDHTLVLETLKEFVSLSASLERLLTNICKYEYLDDQNQIVTNKIGLPTGSHLQLLLQNLYLMKVDLTLENVPESAYARYGDDMIFISRSKEMAIKQAQFLKRRLECHFHLSLNEEKSRRVCLVKPHQIPILKNHNTEFVCSSYFDYLGITINFAGDLYLPSKKARRLHKGARFRLEELAKHIPDELNDTERVQILSIAAQEIFKAGHATAKRGTIGNADGYHNPQQIKEYRRWLNSLILKIALKRGWRKGNFRRFPASKIKLLSTFPSKGE
jgi:hypothetical protein